MPTSPNLGLILDFLDELRQNNNKFWFDQHRPAYETARDTFYQFINGIIDELRASDDLQGLSAKDCVPRIYRDIRFSKDKSPYKTNFSGQIAPGGWGSSWLGYYISIEPRSQSLVAGGFHDPSLEQLDRFRQAISQDATSFKEITNARDFVKTFGAVEGDRLKTAPKGYDRDHPEIALLQLKQILAMHRVSDQEVLRPDFAGQVITACRAMKPFLNYLKDILQ